MEETPLRTSLIISAFMIASGVFDAMAFTFASRMWQGGAVVWAEAAKSGVSFMVGITLYWVSVRYLSRAGVVMPEIQTLLWFGVTIIGVAILGGRFPDWRLLDQFVALNVLLSLGWLLVRTAAH